MNAYFFDIDGVLSNHSQIINPKLVEKLSQLLIKGEILGLISGRGYIWQLENVVKPLEEYILKHSKENTGAIDNLFVSGEFGGVSIQHKNGERVSKIDESVKVPQHVRDLLQTVTEEFNDIVVVETEKHTMFSLAKKHHLAQEEFEHIKSELYSKIEATARAYPDLVSHLDRFSMNVKHKNATKRYATIEVLEWLKEKSVTPEHFYAFGDSISDFDIGEALFEQGLPMNFIFVGGEEELKNHHAKFPFTVTKKNFDLGTLEYLNK